jgi:uncharacterized membrane protein
MTRRTSATRILLGFVTLLLPSACESAPTSPQFTPRQVASFRGLGDLPGGEFHSEALAISDDGRVIVGRSTSSSFPDEGFVRVEGDTLRPLLGPGGAHVASEPRALTPDGSVVAGKIGTIGSSGEAARWTQTTGWIGLGDLAGGGSFSQVLGISANGSLLVGWGSSDQGLESARWEGGAPIAMGDLPGGAVQSSAAAISADGSVIVGTGTSPEGQHVYQWMLPTGMVPLGDLPGGAFASEPFAMTPDGSVIVGESTSSFGMEAFRWSKATGFVGLGDLMGGKFQSLALDVSANGARIVGFGTTGSGMEAFLWDSTQGMRRLADVLLALGATSVARWQLTEATGISADGKTIIGNGTNPAGVTEGWVARLP